jgi:hypothetical protein
MAMGVAMPQQKDPLDKVLQALQLVQAGFGIKTAYDQVKLNKLKTDELEKQKEIDDRRSRNEFLEGEMSNLHIVEPNTPGSATGYVDVIKRTPDGKQIDDPDTGKPVVDRQKFSFFTKDSAQTQAYMQRNEASGLELENRKTYAAGGIPNSDLLNYRIEYKAMPGYQQKWVNNPITGQRETIWVAPRGLKELSSGSSEKDEKELPNWVNQQNKAGWQAARLDGIQDPTPDQALQYSPENIQKAVYIYKDRIDKSGDIQLYGALEKFDKEIGIDGATLPNGGKGSPSTPIEGISKGGDLKANIPFGRYAQGDKEQRNRTAIEGVKNLLLKDRSGAAINKEEAGRLANELSVAYGQNNPAAIREAMAKVRTSLKRNLQNLETGIPSKARDIIRKESPLHSESPLFTGKKLTDEEAANKFIEGI